MELFEVVQSDEDRIQTQRYFNGLYPDYSDMSYDDRWYAEWDKLFISEHLDEMRDRVRRIISAGDISEIQRVLRIALHGMLTDYYSDMLGDNDASWNFISDNLTDVNRKFLDRKFYCNYNSEEFNPKEELASIVGQIKTENRQRVIEN
jgi:hypothetical protein